MAVITWQTARNWSNQEMRADLLARIVCGKDLGAGELCLERHKQADHDRHESVALAAALSDALKAGDRRRARYVLGAIESLL